MNIGDVIHAVPRKHDGATVNRYATHGLQSSRDRAWSKQPVSHCVSSNRPTHKRLASGSHLDELKNDGQCALSSRSTNISLQTRPAKRMCLDRVAKQENTSYTGTTKHDNQLKRFRYAEESDDELASSVKTARKHVREDISRTTLPRRQAFLLAHRKYFLPLLPPRNYITKLLNAQPAAYLPPDAEEVLQPRGVKAGLKSYQLEGLSFLVKMFRSGMPAILGDEMGLGKTLQTLALFQWLKENQSTSGERRPFLVICPLSVLASWMNEVKRWTPNLATHQIHGPKSERVALLQRLKSNAVDVDLVVTTYEVFVAEENWFKRAFVWRYVVLDEGHKIKNEHTNIAHALQTLSAEYRLLVTGTPLQNNVAEAWALLHWLLPEVFTSDTRALFAMSFDLTRGSVSTTVMDHLRRLLEIIMLRRMKSSPGVDLGLPAKEEVLLFIPLTPLQRRWYLQLLTRIDRATLQGVFAEPEENTSASLVVGDNNHSSHDELPDGGSDPTVTEAETTTSSQWKRLQNLVMQLRKVCSHPYLISGAAPVPYELNDAVRLASGKFIVLDKLVDELVVRGKKKILIFSGFTHVLDLVEDLLALQGANLPGGAFKFTRLDGSTARAKRNLGIRMFNNSSTDFRVMLISTRAGGLGINLTSANTVVFMDEDWNPQCTLQAEARAHRIGQSQKVTVYKLCTKGTVEEQMIGRIHKKLYLSTKVTESMRNLHTSRKSKVVDASDPGDGPQLGTSQLQALLRKGAQVLAGPDVDVDEMVGWDWQTILDKCKNKPMSSEVEVDEQAWLNQAERVRTAVFEGKTWQRSQAVEKIHATDLVRSDRRVGKHTTVMVDGFAVDKSSTLCEEWEAVPTLAGKDPRLAERKREKRAAIVNQDHCQVCWDGGEIVNCSGCPRSYHIDCLQPAFRKRARGACFYCPQHSCWDCGKKTADAGGLIYRCRWCENGFCEDCLDWDKTVLLDANIPEFEAVEFYAHQAWFVECIDCLLTKRSAWLKQQGWQMQEMATTEEAEDHPADSSMLTQASESTAVTQSEVSTPRSTCSPGFDGGFESLQVKLEAQKTHRATENQTLDDSH